MTEPNNIQEGKRYRTIDGKIATAVADGVDKGGVAVMSVDGEWCFYYPHALTEVVEIPERWLNVHDVHPQLGGDYPSREEADKATENYDHFRRIGVWHLKSDGTGEFIPTP